MLNLNTRAQCEGGRRRAPALVGWGALGLCLLGLCLLGPALGIGCGETGGSAGSSGAGGGSCGECFRPIECVKQCGGAVIQSGCCACPAGSIDDKGCALDGGHD